MQERTLISNIVDKDVMRETQSKTLKVLKDSLMNSFGPMGSNTIIQLEKALTKYTKDGHTILSRIVFNNVIENSVKSDLEDITRHVVKKIGDGTTSSVILSYIIFENLKKIEEEGVLLPYEIIQQFKDVVEELKEEILSQNQEFNSDRAYDITYISTNGNKEVSENIKNIYEEFGNDVFIDVAISNTNENYLKTYDGMTLDAGYSDTAYINNKEKGICSLRDAEVYCFADPIDNQELMQLFDTIVYNNIMSSYSQNANKAPIPTVIMAPTLSKDLSSYMVNLIEFMYKFPNEANKPPFLLITNIHQQEQFSDIARMCGCKPIRKYINRDIYEEDLAKGLAASIKNISTFAGSTEIVESDLVKTKFVNPQKMHDENGEYTDEFKTLVSFLESELEKAYAENEDANVTGTLKRRINSLKANMVEYLVGGVSASDRDSLRDLVEDSVLNCRAAAIYGVGYGANFEGLRASNKFKNKSPMHKVIYDAYKELSNILYSTCVGSKATEVVEKCLLENKPFNMRSKEFDNKVLCSITTDVVVLDAISQIITLMFTSNQFLTPTPAHNIYLQNK